MTAIQKTLLLSTLFGVWSFVNGQDSLSLDTLKPITHHFDIEDGRLVGAGADFLKKEIAKAQFTLLGDYPESKSSSDFAAALLAELDLAQYKVMALGIGVPSARLLHSSAAEPKSVVSKLKAWNNTYAFTENENLILPMPEMKSVADARFIQKAGEIQWSILGFGNESWNNLSWLLDQMYYKLTPEQQQEHGNFYKSCKTLLQKLYTNRNGNLLEFAMAVKESTSIQDFLVMARAKSPEHSVMVEEFNNSLENCLMHAQKQYFKKNQWRVAEEKRLLRQELDRIGFDLHQDKLFVKWDMNFLSRGFQPYAFYGIGNTLSEIASYNGNTSLHLGIVPRYQLKNGVQIDLMQQENTMASQYAALVQAAKKDEWTVIDLQQMIQDTYYTPILYLLDKPVQDLIKRYDLIIIPALENEITLNYDK